MSEYITASFDTLLGQASDTAAVHLCRAQQEIDSVFGKGYAAKNPQLVAAFMLTASADMAAATHAKVYGAALQEISQSLSAIADAIERSDT
jgi:hypothetical protein